MSDLLRHQLLLSLIASLVFFTNLGGYALFDEDEPKNAVCGREMFERGDWVVPTFNSELRTDKPILIYWWMHLSYKMFGVSEFSARFGSALLSVGTVLLTYHVGRKLYSAEIGLLAGTILGTCLMFSVVGRAATPDATLIFCLMSAFATYVWSVATRRGGHFCGTSNDQTNSWTDLLPAKLWQTLLMYAAMGLAILAKGPIGVLLPCMIIGMFLLIQMRNQQIVSGILTAPGGVWWKRLFQVATQVIRPSNIVQAGLAMHLLMGAAVVLTIALPWYVIVGLRTEGAWLQGFLGDHNVGRFVTTKENHGGPIFYHICVLFFGCFPWSVLFPMAFMQLCRRFKTGAAWSNSDRFLACWSGIWVGFFSLASTKLPNYVLPAYPAIALLTARYLQDWQLSRPGFGSLSIQNACRVLSTIGIAIMIAVPLVFPFVLPGEEWLMVTGAIPLICGALAYRAIVREQRIHAVRVMCASAIAMAVLIVGIAPVRVCLHSDSPILAKAARDISGLSKPRIAVVGGCAPTLIFYSNGPVCGMNPEHVTKYFDTYPEGFIVARADRLDALPQGGKNLIEVCRCKRFLRKFEVVLLARADFVALRSDVTHY